MKKLSLFALAALAMISCSNTADSESQVIEFTKCDVKTMEMHNSTDSINFVLGLINGMQIKDSYLANDSSDGAVAEFINALQRGYYNEVENLSEIVSAGKQLGQVIKMFERKGLFTLPAYQLNEKLLFQGVINGLNGDTTMTNPDLAREFMNKKFAAIQENADLDHEVIKPVVAKCGKKVRKVELETELDSLNFMFGYVMGVENMAYVLGSNDKMDEFIAAVNAAMEKDVYNLQLISMGEQYGGAIRKQEATGLVGVRGLATNFPLLMHGFINGLYMDTTQFTMESAMNYVETALEQIQSAEGRKFLEQNAKKEGVIITESGLQYEVITMGDGPKPSATDRVKVHYHGTLINGTVFDSSVDRGEPITFGLDQVIQGWTEGVQLMPVGSKFKFYIPQELAYGGRATGSIPAYSALIFEVELLGIEK